jgi:hypothetical protein
MSPEVINAVVGAFLPPFIDFINQRVVDSRVRYVISLLISLAIGFVVSLVSGELNAGDVFGGGAIVFAAAQTTYKTYYEKSEVRTKLFGDKS